MSFYTWGRRAGIVEIWNIKNNVMGDGWFVIGQDDWLNSQRLLVKWLRNRLEKAQVATGNLPKAMVNMKTSIQSLFTGKDLGQLVEIEGDAKTPWKKEDYDISCVKGKRR